jgi:hypothetical protein
MGIERHGIIAAQSWRPVSGEPIRGRPYLPKFFKTLERNSPKPEVATRAYCGRGEGGLPSPQGTEYVLIG